MRERQKKKKKGRTWAEAAKTVLEKYPNTPMSHKEILQVIQRERLKEISGTSPLACLNAMLHTNSRGEEGIFYKVPGRMGVYTLKDISEVATELSEEESEESSDNLSDSRSSENNSGPQEGRRRRWMRPVASKQPTSPQPRCSSPSVAAAKLISPSQKHSKKALKQALKQQQQRNQRRQAAMPATSSSRLLLKTIKDMADNISAKTDLCLPVGPRKVSQRSGRLSTGHLKRNRCKIDVETPDSILVNTNLRAIINKHTFSVLPPDCQQRLLRLLPEVDQQACTDGGLLKVTSSALNNEFFTSAAQSWKERLAEGEFTPELQLRMRQEIEKEKKVEHWKEAFFESYYGENSGLSFEESKEMTKADLKWEPKPRLPRQAVTKECSLTDGSAAVKDSKSTAAQEKTQAPPKESLAIPELMKTRRSQKAEDRKMPAPTLRPEPKERNRRATAETQTQPSVKEDKTELPQSPVTASLLPETGMKVKEDPPTSGIKPPEETKAEPEGASASEQQKRKTSSETEDEATPEKRQRISSVSSVSSISSVSPPASSIPSPATPTSAANQRVPPLKIPVSRILPIPESPSQVSPRTPLPASTGSPVRTGARTLADIKAKAQLARAQRAAAAAASRGAVPGSGQVAGSGELTKPSPGPGPTSPHASARLAVNTISTPPSCPQDFLSPSHLNIQDVGAVSAQTCSDSGPECQETFSGSTRTSSYIPENNPLVTRLLQGKEVPLEQILPKPLAKVEVKMSGVHSSKGKTPQSAPPEHHQCNTAGWALSDSTRYHKEPLDKDTQEQILQTVIERKVQQRQPKHQAARGEEHQDQPWISVGFLGRKRTPRPAMSGHYLLNVSTYGRGSESKRSHQAATPNVAGLKRETADGQESAREGTFEQQGSSVSKSEQAGNLLPCHDIKTEPGFEANATVENSPRHKQLSNQGKSEPYLPLKDPSHQRPSAFPTPRMSIHQESLSSRYGGTISVSVPHTLNRAATAPDAASVMSFSVTVTTIPDSGDRSAPPAEPSFMEAAGMEDAQSKCYCRLKAMIMCKGCGAFCHDDCIGPSELCVSCLVVR
ncbi:putative Polycomb group protein ASXL2 isoform X2 [Vanacampus margaritifer]